jgi:hypothetical protein
MDTMVRDCCEGPTKAGGTERRAGPGSGLVDGGAAVRRRRAGAHADGVDQDVGCDHADGGRRYEGWADGGEARLGAQPEDPLAQQGVGGERGGEDAAVRRADPVSTEQFAATLRASGWPQLDVSSVPGGHGWQAWSAELVQSLTWVGRLWCPTPWLAGRS